MDEMMADMTYDSIPSICHAHSRKANAGDRRDNSRTGRAGRDTGSQVDLFLGGQIGHELTRLSVGSGPDTNAGALRCD